MRCISHIKSLPTASLQTAHSILTLSCLDKVVIRLGKLHQELAPSSSRRYTTFTCCDASSQWWVSHDLCYDTQIMLWVFRIIQCLCAGAHIHSPVCNYESLASEFRDCCSAGCIHGWRFLSFRRNSKLSSISLCT